MTNDRHLELNSPEIDLLLEGVWPGPRTGEAMEPELADTARRCLEALGMIRPEREGRDRIWRLWLRTSRGPIESFGDFDECLAAGDVASREEFEELWRLEYPDDVQWRRLSVVFYDQRLFFFFGRKLEVEMDLGTGSCRGADVKDPNTLVLVMWLIEAAEREARRFARDPAAYNEEIARDLPPSRRLGRIARSELWHASSDVIRFDHEVGADALLALRRLVSATDPDATVERVTLADFLDWCRICYEANGYERTEGLSSTKEMYRAMADNRDEGLLELAPDDPQAFSTWYRERARGGHPWEICRGGNRTHITLQVYPHREAWQLLLAGFSQPRAVETVKMAVALHEHGVPFVLTQGEELVRMIAGEDDIGIVPEDISIGYNHGSFPAEHRIHSFAHLYTIEDIDESLVERIRWYPLDPLEPESAGP